MRREHASPRIRGWELRRLRQERGQSVTALAREIGISPPYLSQIERGHRPTVSSKTFNLILEAVGVKRAVLECAPDEVSPYADRGQQAVAA